MFLNLIIASAYIIGLGGCSGVQQSRDLAQEVAIYSALLSEEIASYKHREKAVLQTRQSIVQEMSNALSDAELRFELGRSSDKNSGNSSSSVLERSISSWIDEVNRIRKSNTPRAIEFDNETVFESEQINSLVEFSKTMTVLGKDSDIKNRVKFFGNYAKAVSVSVKAQKSDLESGETTSDLMGELEIFKALKSWSSENE